MKEYNIVYSMNATIQRKQYEPTTFFASCGIKTDDEIDINEAYKQVKKIVSEIIGRDIQLSEVKRRIDAIQNLRTEERNGVTYVSVTSILGYLYPIDYPQHLLDVYSLRGDIVHKAIESFLKKGTYAIDEARNEELKKKNCSNGEKPVYLNALDIDFLGWWKKYGTLCAIKEEDVEKRIYNDSHYFYGTCDAYGFYGNKLAIIDFKTSKTIDKGKREKYFKQLAAYSLCVPAEVLVIVPLTEKVVEPIVATDLKPYQEMFLDDVRKFHKAIGMEVTEHGKVD